MLLNLSFVPVIQIKSNVPRSEFPENELEKYAQLILEAEGTLKPLILRPESFGSYKVIEGHFEYYAACRAREVDRLKGEMIGAFILENEKEKALYKQLEFLDKSTPEITNTSDKRLTNVESRLTNVEMRIEARINDLKNDMKQDYQSQIDNLQNQLAETNKKLPETMDILEALNNFDLQKLEAALSQISFRNKPVIINNIVKTRENKGKFNSFADVISKVDQLGPTTMIKIVDHFSKK